MDKELRQRLDLLEKSGQIDGSTVENLEDFVKIIENTLSIKITEENGSMFVTHMAMAITRIKADEKITALDDSLLEELKSTSVYEKIPFIIEQFEDKSGIIIPETEYGYIGLHLGNLGYKE